MSFAECITCKLAKIGQYYSRYAFSRPDRNNFATILAPGNFSFHSQTVAPFLEAAVTLSLVPHSAHIHCFHLFSFLHCTSAKCIPKKPRAILLGALVMMFSYVST